jgi:serine protease Do
MGGVISRPATSANRSSWSLLGLKMTMHSDPHPKPDPSHSDPAAISPGIEVSADGAASDAAAPGDARRLVGPVLIERIDTGTRIASPTGRDLRKGSTAVGASASTKRIRPSGPDPVVQSLMLLVTMAVMLAAARFAVPSVVEEIRYAWHRGELRAEYETGTEGLRNVSLDALSDAYEMVTAAVGPSVVHIEVQRRPEIDLIDVKRTLSTSPHSDQGSGVIVDASGYLLTNHHVVADGEDIMVTLSDGRRVGAIVIGNDALTDLAVLKVDADGLIPITWGDSDRCRVGSPVWAVGSPFGLDRTVTFGILSGKHRKVFASTQYQDFMQSDVAVNPGNSGGPLVDARGTLIGINTAIVGDTYQGVSFSIPSNVAKEIYERLRDTGRVDRGWLGVALLEVPEDQIIGENLRVRGALVREVTHHESPAAMAGLKPGDVIIKVDRQPIRDTAHLMQLIARSVSGSMVTLDVVRDTESIEMPVRLGMRPIEYNQ